jgi:enoyl-CoA hydratase/carnithine racemase
MAMTKIKMRRPQAAISREMTDAYRHSNALPATEEGRDVFVENIFHRGKKWILFQKYAIETTQNIVKKGAPMSNTVIRELKDGILSLTLNRPEKKNAFNTEQWESLAAELNAARENDDVVVAVITGMGKDFSAGQDLADASLTAETPTYQVCEQAVVDFDKPLIAAARGVAVGGGATILFHCDILYVGESLRMRMPFMSLGIAPEFASTYMLQANIGARQAAELIFTAEWIDADRALETGIATRKFKDDELLQNTMAKAAEIAQWPMSSLREAKRCLKLAHRAGIGAALKAERESMQRQKGGPENMEAMMAFLEKRKPNFRNLKK